MDHKISAKRQIKVTKLSKQEDASLLPKTTPEQRWAMMGQLALDAWTFKGEPVAEPGFYRHIISVFRRKG